MVFAVTAYCIGSSWLSGEKKVVVTIIKGKYKFIIILFCAAVILFVLLTNMYYPLRSYIIMFPLSKYYQYKGLFRHIPLSIPSGDLTQGQSFYPFILYFNAKQGFARFMGEEEEDLQVSIIYNFGGFRFGSPYADYFDRDADAYSAFYGAYAVNNRDLFFSAEGNPLTEKIGSIGHYDQRYLVMPSIGKAAGDVVFEQKVISVTRNVRYIGIEDWFRIDAALLTNGAAHVYRSDQLGYLQYGVPKGLFADVDYQPQEFSARAYCRYFEKYDATIVLYIIAKNNRVVEQIDRQILSRSVLKQ